MALDRQTFVGLHCSVKHDTHGRMQSIRSGGTCISVFSAALGRLISTSEARKPSLGAGSKSDAAGDGEDTRARNELAARPQNSLIKGLGEIGTFARSRLSESLHSSAHITSYQLRDK